MTDPVPLAVTLGAVRDSVTCIENFAQLLGSRRVGPRQLPHAVPEVQAGCAALVVAFADLERAVVDQLSGDPEGLAALRVMLAHASTEVRDLGTLLEGREKGPIETRERLKMEAVVTRVAGELATLLRVADLFGATASPRTTEVDLGVVLAQRRPQMRSVLTPVLAVFEIRTTEPMIADARVVLELLEFAVATVVRAGVDPPRMVAERANDGALIISVGELTEELPLTATRSGAVPPHVVNVLSRAPLPEEATVIRAAAKRAGITLEIKADSRAITLRFE